MRMNPIFHKQNNRALRLTALLGCVALSAKKFSLEGNYEAAMDDLFSVLRDACIGAGSSEARRCRGCTF
jgi:hypothetical protein